MLIYCLCGCKVTKKKIIQTNNSPKNDIFQTNNLLKNDFFQRNNSWKLTFSKQIICRKMTFSKEIIFFERGGNWDFLYLRSFRCFRTLRSWKRHKVCLNMNFAKFEEFASAYFFLLCLHLTCINFANERCECVCFLRSSLLEPCCRVGREKRVITLE